MCERVLTREGRRPSGSAGMTTRSTPATTAPRQMTHVPWVARTHTTILWGLAGSMSESLRVFGKDMSFACPVS